MGPILTSAISAFSGSYTDSDFSHYYEGYYGADYKLSLNVNPGLPDGSLELSMDVVIKATIRSSDTGETMTGAYKMYYCGLSSHYTMTYGDLATITI